MIIRITIFELDSCFPTPWQNHEYVNGLLKNPQEYKNNFQFMCVKYPPTFWSSSYSAQTCKIHARQQTSQNAPKTNLQ